jgi:hypothetical protein
MRNLCLSLCLLPIIFSACSPSPGIVATAMAQTQVALSAKTPHLSESAPTFTPELPTDTQTPAPTITSTPDVRVIRAELEDILCDKQDFPSGGGYFLPEPDVMVYYYDNNGIRTKGTFKMYHSYHKTNDILISADDLGKADKAVIQKFLAETGRLDGMWAGFKKGKTDFAGPPDVICNVESFETNQGALLAVQKYNAAEISEAQGWEYVEGSPPGIGSAAVFLKNKNFAKDSYSAIQFAYRNYRVTISAADKTPLKEINSAVLYLVAQQILKKLDNASLGAP